MLDFLCIGAQKAGTSWLHHQLDLLPEIYFPRGKEVHYWDWVERKKRKPDHFWYMNVFREHHHLICGDMTPYYAILDIHLIHEIKILYPDVKIIYIMRNPIDRAWSAFKMDASNQKKDPLKMSRKDILDILHSQQSIQRGDHQKIIENWRSVFPSENILLLDFDDMLNDKRYSLAKVVDFLGVSQQQLNFVSQDSLISKINKGIDISMPLDIYNDLNDLYREKIISLQDYLKKDLSKWLTK